MGETDEQMGEDIGGFLAGIRRVYCHGRRLKRGKIISGYEFACFAVGRRGSQRCLRRCVLFAVRT